MLAKMNLLAGLFLLQLSVFVSCLRTPSISYISQEQIRDIGGTVELSCSVIYGQEFPVHWVKHRAGATPLTISSGAGLIIVEPRFSLRYDKAATTYTLQIKDIQETDAGEYECQIIQSVSAIIHASVKLLIRQPPRILDNSTVSAVVSEGEPVQLDCWALGVPRPKITWRKENNALLSTGGSSYRSNTFKIPAVRKEDRGTYYCVADNEVGRSDKRRIDVQVKFAPIVSSNRPRLGQALQYDMILECKIDGYPLPAISWIKDEIELSTNQHYELSQFAATEDHTDANLRVITIEKKQYGKYLCRATNIYGTAETSLELYETNIPICPPACGDTSYGSGSFITSSGLLLAVILAILVSLN